MSASLLTRAGNRILAKLFRKQRQLKAWKLIGYSPPAPSSVKWCVLGRHGFLAGTWIETGTYMGETTHFLANKAAMVYTIEPEPSLAAKAKLRFSETKNVNVIEGLSEDVLEDLIDLTAEPLSLWLDGHYSAGVTHKGPIDTPIREELRIIASKIAAMKQVAVLVDDFRCFDPTDENYADYPKRSWLVEWAENNNLEWTIEHDIFCAYRRVRLDREMV